MENQDKEEEETSDTCEQVQTPIQDCDLDTLIKLRADATRCIEEYEQRIYHLKRRIEASSASRDTIDCEIHLRCPHKEMDVISSGYDETLRRCRRCGLDRPIWYKMERYCKSINLIKSASTKHWHQLKGSSEGNE